MTINAIIKINKINKINIILYINKYLKLIKKNA
uniref:Uncharacterized protein n=1 Tax=viral metagenome TaxID=1070528 RepID=A0A6C0I165_9ZZZZ